MEGRGRAQRAPYAGDRREARVPQHDGQSGDGHGRIGDVLTGVIAALLGQGLAPWDAARLGVHVHGLAGDLAAGELCEVSLIASDLVRFLPAAFRQMAAVRDAGG